MILLFSHTNFPCAVSVTQIVTYFYWHSLGMDCMRLKTKRKLTAEKNSNQQKQKMKLNQTTDERWCVTQRAASSDKQCPMRIILKLSPNKQWFVYSSSSLEHHNHPPLEDHTSKTRTLYFQ